MTDRHIVLIIYSTNLDISIDPFSGRNPSYCFIDLDHSEDSEAVLRRLEGYRIRGRPTKINYDTGRRSKGRQRSETRMQPGPWELTTGSPMVFDRYAWKDAREHWTKPVQEGRRLFVGGLSDECNQGLVNGEMRRLFSGFDIQAVSKRVLPRQSSPMGTISGRCYCFVDLPSAQEAGDAVAALDGTPTAYGGAYKIAIAHDQQDRKVCREQTELLASPRETGHTRRDLSSNWRSRD